MSTATPQSLKATVFLLLLYYKQTSDSLFRCLVLTVVQEMTRKLVFSVRFELKSSHIAFKCHSCGATNVASTQKDEPLLFIEEGTPFPDTLKVFERTKVCSWVPTGFDTKNDCAGEYQ
jgi:hypothetical protein